MKIQKILLLISAVILSVSAQAEKPLDWAKFDTKAFIVLQKEAGTRLNYLARDEAMKWSNMLKQVREGEYDATGSATITAERRMWAKFSSGYRMEEEVAFMSNKLAKQLSVDLGKPLTAELRTAEFINYIKENKLKVGVLKDARHANSVLDAFVKDPANADYIVAAASDWDHVNLLLNGKVDLISMDRVKANGLVYAKGQSDKFREYRISAKTPVSYIINRNVSDATIDKLNAAITRLTLDGTLSKMAEDYIKGR